MGNESDKSNEFSILISTCKAYQDVMINWVLLYNKFNVHLDYNVYVITDGYIENLPSYINQIVYDSADWQARLRYALDSIPSKYLFLFLEDYFFKTSVDKDKLNLLTTFIRSNDINYCRMTNIPRQNLCSDNGIISTVDFSKRHAVNLQLAVWNKIFLQSLLSSGSAWALEDKFNKISVPFEMVNKFAVDSNNIIPLTNGIIKGKVDLKVNDYYEKEHGFKLEYVDRRSLTPSDYLLIYFKSKGRYIRNKKIRIFLKKFFGFLGVGFVTKD
ncbi:hypothetical protein [Shewanella chilikensis]|uniref:hypothetical protein n=1 Tax=Shewanella chilikensis TaxID=558541 RepID=UPI00399ABAEF